MPSDGQPSLEMTLKLECTEGKAYKKGALLLTEKPFAFVLTGKLHSERCDYCFSKTDLLKCTGCSFAHYCDRDCQKRAWVYHKWECCCLKKVSPMIVPDAARMLARIIKKLEKGGAHERSFYSKTKFRVFRDLMSHYEDIKKDEEKMEHFISLRCVLGEYLGEESLPNGAELLGIYGRMIINTFNILDFEMQSIGTGLYLAASVIDHSCSPNAVAVFEGTTIYIRTLKNINSINWSDVNISYINPLNLPSKRQKELQSMYYFLCQCPKCLDKQELMDMTSVICQNKDCQEVIPGGLLDVIPTCTKCNHKLSDETWEKMHEVACFTEKQLENMKDIRYLDVCRMCLEKQKGLFHNTNIHRVKILDMSVEACIGLKNWEAALAYGLEVKDHLRKYYGEHHPVYGIFLMEIGKISLYLEKLDDAKVLLLEAGNILMVTHSERHPLVKNELHSLLQQCSMK